MNRLAFPPIAAVRPYLALKATMLLLTFDMWITRASHAGRYGAGGFNVAHWPWLDWIQPEISPPLYVGACVLTSILCVGIVFGRRPPRWLIGLTLGVHTWSWAMSMLDSYQHHYLLSLVLACMAFFPPMNAEEALTFDPVVPKKPEPEEHPFPGAGTPGVETKSGLLAPYPLASVWAYGLLAASISVVYAYTAISKTAPEWLSGASLRRVMHYPVTGAPADDASIVVELFYALAEMDGEGGQTFFYGMGHSVVLLQIVCMAGYLLAPWRDVAKSKWMQGFFLIAMGTALSFHFGAELMGLEIGWFGYYMIGYALIFFLPANVLVAIARAVIWPRRDALGAPAVLLRLGFALCIVGVGESLEWTLPRYIAGAVLLVAPLRWLARGHWGKSLEETPAELALALVSIAGVGLATVGWYADLPGTREAALLGAVLLAFGAIASLMRDGHTRSMLGYGVGASFCAVALLASLSFSDLRWDYWRNVGGDHRRRGEAEEAYRAYVMANRYAPEGEDRNRQQAEMRAILVERGSLPPEDTP